MMEDIQKGDIVRALGTIVILLSLWLLMSGIYKPMIVGFGVASVILVMFFVHRMNKADENPLIVELNPIATVRYFLWLLMEIAKSNWAVSKIIVAKDMPLNQHMFRVPYSQRTDLAQVIFANSITLTPGTITVETEDGEFLVHAVDYSDSDIEDLAEMNRQVQGIEQGAGA